MIQASGLAVPGAVANPQDENGIVPDPVADQVGMDDRELSQSTDGLTSPIRMSGQAVSRRLKASRQTNVCGRVER